MCERGILERPVEFVVRAVQGLPNGSFRAVRDAFYELLAEDALVIFGPWVSENGVALRPYVEKAAEVPIITMGASESMLGEWVFGLPAGSMEEEPIIMATVAALDGCRTVGLAFEDSLIGREYLRTARFACEQAGLTITAEVAVPQVEADKRKAMATLAADKPDALMHVGFGLGLIGMNEALEAVGWMPRRYTTTAFEFAATADWWRHQLAGWIGLDQYDERNLVAQEFLDRFEEQARAAARVFLSTLLLRRRPADDDRAGDGAPVERPRGQRGAGADQDASRRQRSARHATALRQVHPARVDGERIPGGPPRAARRQPIGSARHDRGSHRASPTRAPKSPVRES